MDSVNSTTFIKRPLCMSDAQEGLLYTKEVLSRRIFLGSYEERRYVPDLKEYRDLIIINPEEIELHQDLDKVRKKLSGITGLKWVGITGPETVGMPKSYCFWVKLSDVAFGHYWFLIKHVKLIEGEVLLQLKCIRKTYAPAHPTTNCQIPQPNVTEKQTIVNEEEEPDTSKKIFSSNKDECQQPFGSLASVGRRHEEEKKDDWNIFLKERSICISRSCEEAFYIIQPFITWKNIFTAVKVTCAMIIAIIMGTLSLIGNLGEYFLKLVRELSLLIQVLTPILIHLINFFSKIIGGLFILLAGIFGRNAYNFSAHNPRQNKMYSIPYSSLTPPLDWRERNKILRQELLSNPKRQ